MIEKSNGHLKWYEFELFQDFPMLRHAVFTRHGGVSGGPFSGLNLSISVGDDRKAVDRNFQTIAEVLGADELISAKQVHGAAVVEAQAPFPQADGMATDCPGRGLLMTHADCQAAILFDPETRSLGMVHAGWRGSVQNIYRRAVAFMERRYGSKPESLRVGISPSLGPESAEFVHYRTELPPEFWDYQARPQYFDFWKISRMQLQDCGVLQRHIEIAGIDTMQDEDFFSYRRCRSTGRNGTAAVLGIV